MKWLEVFHYKRGLEPDDCVFPAMGANGVIQPREPLSHDTVQKWINEATSGAGISGSFSTHCFRRGGAQYHFMFAPVGQRWPLAKVRWWGGWAEQEHRDTLIRYLLDELYTYETDYSDALAPVARGANESLVGEATLVQPMSTEELRLVHTSITTDVQGLRVEIDNVTGVVRELARVILQSHELPTASSTSKHIPPQMTPLTIKIPPRVAGTPSAVVCGSVPLLPSSNPTPASTTTHSRQHPHTTVIPTDSSGAATLFSITNLGRHANGVPGGKAPHRPSSHSIPKASLVIPDVPVLCPDRTRRLKKDSWRDIVKHWLFGDPKLDLHTPLKDWPPEWTQGANRLFAVKYFERSTIALKFINNYESDEARFLAAYPQAERGHTALLYAINAARRERGERSSRPRRSVN
ncbi:hypothetical protein PAXRUDRAFT_833918 [Paxillus rubicundulus Ve08.2h10]|uniref:Uncharacterized protein n=1 Tax=Paxillus rubicundulus Ve08.2h10 TaxID=930991 RepID=A0A0D0DMR2_9AGAM|nr:hypothetical protein PAXRUDRAFT_833918 [Paxillus rubicundulus Ve08.2h10]